MPEEEEAPDETGEKDDEDAEKMETAEKETIALFDDSDDSPYVSKEVFLHVITNLNNGVVNVATALATIDAKLKKATMREAISMRVRIGGQIEVFIRGDAKDKRWLRKAVEEQTRMLIDDLGIEDTVSKNIDEVLFDPSVA